MDTPASAAALLIDLKVLSGLSEIAIAQRLGISQPTVNRILHGKSDCKGSTLLAIQQWWNELKQSAEPTGSEV